METTTPLRSTTTTPKNRTRFSGEVGRYERFANIFLHVAVVIAIMALIANLFIIIG